MESTDIVREVMSLQQLNLKGAKGFQHFSYARQLNTEDYGFGKVQHVGVFFAILEEAIKLHLSSYIKENLLKMLEQFKIKNPDESDSEIALVHKLINCKSVDKLFEQYESKHYDSIMFNLAKFSLYYQKKQNKQKFENYMKNKDKEWIEMYKAKINNYYADQVMDDYSKLYFRLLAFGLNVSIKVIRRYQAPKEDRVQIYMSEEKQDLTVYILVMSSHIYILQREDAHQHYLEQLILPSLDLFTQLIYSFNEAIQSEKYNKKRFLHKYAEITQQFESALREFEGSPYRDLRVIEESKRIWEDLRQVKPEEVFELMNKEEGFE